MAVDLTDEIVQDFLIEAGEILEQLGEQLVDLESRPEDSDLLNAVFRGFHTIKGGAGFIGLGPMVDVCHRAEETFSVLRNGERVADSLLMDVMLQVLDALNDMFDQVRAGQDPQGADPEIMRKLGILAENGNLAADAPASVAPARAPARRAVDEMPGTVDEAPGAATDRDIAAHAGHGAGKAGQPGEPLAQGATPAGPVAGGDEITDDEFEALLDELHGGGAPATAAPAAGAAGRGSDGVSDEEFGDLVDRLHRTGTAGGGETPAARAPPAVSARPAAKAAAKAPPPIADPTVRVDTGVLDRIMNMVGELVLVRNRISTLETSSSDEEMAKAVGNLDVVTADLQAAVMRTRMQPIRKVFGRFPRVVRDLARSLGKEIDLVLQGEDTDLDKNLVEALADPMVHLVRNAVDHGLERPAERSAAGKATKGTVTLSAEQEGDQILLIVSDDGRGMDSGVLRRKAVEKGLMDEDAAARLDDRDAYHLIFAPGFSTKSEISDVSGRGVGMDVVKSRITQLNGSVDIDSTFGEGTRILIKVPLTLAIVPTLMVVLGDQPFALPLVNVKEIFDLDLRKINVVDGQLTVVVRGKPLPLFYLGEWLVKGHVAGERDRGHVVVVHVGTQMVGFVVDQLVGQEEVVIKPLGALLHGTKGLAGATITGDGRIALILDAPGLLSSYASAR